ncbi:mitochondrial glyco protein [Delitschia confertaspora ATCC 74209]|uniref:Mitochondrial glyco protein n=1 Tax=Delitschia confertaspora ATCC 74209 TaxID=1513339 RepID=A0A9P4JEH7_9PLEO|nr:mitochondrial glyco protein [Delitschia confertaspora ATCC 74209]
MFSLRNAARSAPRSFARISSKAIRPQAPLFRQAALYQPSWTQTVSRLGASFHSSSVRKQDSNVNEELVAKLQSEIAMEERYDDEDLSENIKEYLDNSPFTVEEKPGHQEVVLTRTFGDEKISITFTTADMNNQVPNEAEDQDPAMYEDDVDNLIGESQSGGANTKGAVNQGKTPNGNIRIAPEDQVAPADREELNDEMDYNENQQGFPAHASIRIERPGKGALAIEAVAQDGDFLIEDVFHFQEADLADPQTAEKDWQRRTLYTGPPFGNLDEDLQYLLEKYLEERGINTRLALFIPDYIDYKEQKEYVSWLKNVKKFVE